MITTAPGHHTLLTDLMPRYDRRTVHGRAVAATVERTADAMRSTPLSSASLARVLLAIRTRGASWGTELPSLHEIDRDPELPFTLIAETPFEVVIGFVGRPWPRGGPAKKVDREAFRTYEVTNDVRVGMSIRCSGASYGSLLVTETRIEVGPAARRQFGRYWRVVAPASGLVRSSFLGAIARHAEAPE